MTDETRKPNEANERRGEASELSAVLSCAWTLTKDKLPPKGCAVLVDGKDWPTYMVAVYEPKDKEFPWAVYAGYDAERFSIDAFDCWMDLPQMRAR